MVEDPFKTKSAVANSPEKMIEDPFKTKFAVANSPEKMVEQDPFKTKSAVANSPEKLTKDPFKTKSAVANSPEKMVEQDPSKTKSGIVNSPEKMVEDPFKTKSAVANSPEKMIGDPFKTKSGVANSPEKIFEQDPFKTKSAVANSPEKMVEQDPFKTKFSVANSLENRIEDPFKTNSAVANSPEKMVEDPFKTKSAVANSPEKIVEDPFKTKCQEEYSPEKATDENIFDTKMDLVTTLNIDATASSNYNNSILSQENNHSINLSGLLATKIDLVSLDETAQSVGYSSSDTITEIVNSSSTQGSSVDPLNQPSKGAVTPSNSEDLPMESSTSEDDMFPFISGSHNPNSPTVSVIDKSGPKTELFKTVSLLSNSPLKQALVGSPVDPVKHKSTSRLVDPQSQKEPAAFDAGPFNSKSKLPNSSSQNKDQVFSTSPKDQRPNILTNTPVSSQKLSALVNKTPMSKLSSAVQQPLPETPASGEVQALEEEMFVPATEAFADPSFFDALEKASGSCPVNLKRGSVLMKFDPLQDSDVGFAKPVTPDFMQKLNGPSQKGPRVSDIFKRQNKSSLMTSFANSPEDSICLFGTPPKVSRRRTLTSKMHSRNKAMVIEEETSGNQVDMYFDMENEGDGMDTILSDNILPDDQGEKLVDVAESAKYTDNDVKQIRSTLALQFNEVLLKKDREYQERMKEVEEKAAERVKEVEEKAAERVKEVEQHNSELKSKAEASATKVTAHQEKNTKLKDVIKDYDAITKDFSVKEATLTKQVEDHVKQEQVREQEFKELEKSFDDMLHRYNRLKAVLEKATKNEGQLKEAITVAQEKYKTSQEKAKKIKEMAETKIREQEEHLQKVESSSKSDITRLETALKRKEMDVGRLESSLEQKKKECVELTELCDSLISKVS